MKKQIISVFLALTIVLSFVSIPALAEEYTYTQQVQSYEYSNKTLSVTAKISNNTNASPILNGYAAVYSKDGTFKCATKKTFSVKANKTETIVYEIENYTFASNDYVKLLLWDDNFAPVSEYVTDTVAVGTKIEGVVVQSHKSSPLYENGDEHYVDIIMTASDSETFEVGECWSFLENGTNAAAYLGYSVTAIVGMDDYKNCYIYDIAPKANANTFITIDTELIDEISDEEITYYPSETAQSPTTAEIQNYMRVGYEEYELDNIVVNGFNTDYDPCYDLFDYIYYIDEITLLDNDNDGDFEFVFATIPTEDSMEFVVDEIYIEEGIYFFTDEYEDGVLCFDPADSSVLFTFIKDGETVDVSSIKEGDTLTCLDICVNVFTIYVSSKTVTGTIDEMDEDYFYINGEPYKASPISYYYYEFQLGDTGIFYINAFDEIAAVSAISPPSEYYFLLDADEMTANFGDNTYLVKAMNSSGEKVVLQLQNKRIELHSEYDECYDLYDDEAYDIIQDEIGGIAKLSLNDNGEIYKIFLPGYSSSFTYNDMYEDDAYMEMKTFNKNRLTYGVVDLSEDTIIFNVTEEGYDFSVQFSTVGELFVDGASYSFIAYGEEDNVAEALVTFDIEIPEEETPEEIIGESEYVFMTAAADVSGSFGNNEYLIRVITTEGNTKDYALNKTVSVFTEDGEESNIRAKYAYGYIEDYYGTAKIALTESGKVAQIYLEGCDTLQFDDTYCEDADNKTAAYNQSTKKYGKITLSNDTVIFNVDTKTYDVTVSTVGKAFENNTSYSFIAYGSDASKPHVITTIDASLPAPPEEEVVVGESEYVFVLDWDEKVGSFGANSYLVKVMNTAGEINTYPIAAKNVDIYTIEGVEAGLDADDAFDYFSYQINSEVIKIALTQNGEVADFYFPGCEDFSYDWTYSEDSYEKNAYYDEDTNTYGTISLSSETKVFCFYSDDNYLKICSVAEVLKHGQSYNIVPYGKEGSPADLLFVVDPTVAFDAEAPVMVVTKVSYVLVDDEETTKLTGIQSGELVSVIVDPDEWLDDIEAGNVIIYSIADNFATDVSVLFTSNMDETGYLCEGPDIYPDDFSDEFVTIHYGEIEAKTSQTVTIDGIKFYFAPEVNVTFVNYTSAKPSVVKGSLSSIKPSNTVYYRTAFVKTLSYMEDEISDIVIFVETAN